MDGDGINAIHFASMVCAIMFAIAGVVLFLGSIFGVGRPQSFSNTIGYIIAVIAGIIWYLMERSRGYC